MVFNGWCKTAPNIRFPTNMAQVFHYGSMLKNMGIRHFSALLWFSFRDDEQQPVMQLETSTFTCVEGKGVKKKGWREKERKALVAALEADACSASPFNLPQPFSAISKSGTNQTTCFHVWPLRPSRAAVFLFCSALLPSSFPSVCADAR